MGNKSSAQKAVYLLVPDLLTQPLTKDLPTLKKILSKASVKKTQASNYLETLFELFNLSEDKNLPIAAITHLYDTKSNDDCIWLRADPIYLRANHHQVTLLESDYLDLSQSEANKIIETLNHYYQQDNLEFSAPTPHRWYVKLPHFPKVNFTSLPEVMGKNIYATLPTGEEQSYWQSLFNEIQMLLHSHPVNEQREVQQQFLVNSLWFWGAGPLPVSSKTSWQCVGSDDSVACGLACLTNTTYIDNKFEAETWLNQLDDAGNYLLTLIPKYHQVENRQAWLTQLENTWFTPIFNALKQKKIDQLILYPCNQQILHIPLQKWWQKLF